MRVQKQLIMLSAANDSTKIKSAKIAPVCILLARSWAVMHIIAHHQGPSSYVGHKAVCLRQTALVVWDMLEGLFFWPFAQRRSARCRHFEYHVCLRQDERSSSRGARPAQPSR